VIAQQVMMAMIARSNAGDPEELHYSMDSWSGYLHERMDLIRFLAERKIANPIVLTGDVHSNWANELRVDDREPDRPIVASEFVGTSITSGGDRKDPDGRSDRLMSMNRACASTTAITVRPLCRHPRDLARRLHHRRPDRPARRGGADARLVRRRGGRDWN
jgi:phosphodiesterase/alkaline phosphatase D-like protein